VRKPRHPCSPKLDQEPWRKLSSKLCQTRRVFALSGAPVSVGQVAAEAHGNGRPDMFSVTGMNTPSVYKYVCNYIEALKWTDEYSKDSPWVERSDVCSAFEVVFVRVVSHLMEEHFRRKGACVGVNTHSRSVRIRTGAE
jgi:hypothetical protein